MYRDDSSSEDRVGSFRELFDNGFDPILVLDLSGRVVDANRAFCSLLGYEKEEILGLELPALQPDGELSRALGVVDEIRKNGARFLDEIVFRTKDGSSIDMEGGVVALSNGEETLMAGSFRDITARKQAHDVLKAQMVFLDTTIEQSPFAMWVAEPSGLIIRTNKALCDTLNLTNEQIVGNYNVLNDANLVEQGLMAQVRAVFEEKRSTSFVMPWAAEKGGTENFKGGRDLWIEVTMFPVLDAEGNMRNVVCQWVDISDLKNAEQKLQEHADRLEEVVAKRTSRLRRSNSDLKATTRKLTEQMTAREAAEEKIRSLNNELEAKVALQHEAILELSTPIIKLWEHAILIPMVGVIDTERARIFMEQLLEAIVKEKAKVVILDLTGVPVVDTQVARYLINAVRGASMLGARVTISGVSPAMAQTLVNLDSEVEGARHVRNLQMAISETVRGFDVSQ